MDSAIVWRESPDFKPGIKTEGCAFDYNGRHYQAFRDTTGTVLALCKRERSNGRGRHYERLNLKGAAARKVLRAVFSAGESLK
jgi:hypothetical protein